MTYAIIDTETTGLFDFKIPADAPGQARMASFAALLLDQLDDEPIEYKRYIKPDGWTIDGTKAGEINGLTDEFLHEHGVPVAQVLDEYIEMVGNGRVMIAYNAQFDLKVMRAELRRAGRDDLFERTKNICVMRPMTDIMQLPARNGRGGFKFPSLAEACGYFGITNESAHDAMGDARAALEIARRLDHLGLMPEAAVHYAKSRQV